MEYQSHCLKLSKPECVRMESELDLKAKHFPKQNKNTLGAKWMSKIKLENL